MSSNLNYRKTETEKDKDYKLGLLFALIPVVLFALILCNKTMPYAEGWYTYYAQLINDGQVVYRDFEYLFMPGYITFIALFTKIFGYAIIPLRILGVVFFALIAYFAYRIFNELFNPFAACMGTLVTAFYLQSEVVQIFYDYIRMMDIFAYLTIFLMIKISKNIIAGKKINFKLVVLAGFANAMVLMIKQNIGLILGFFVFIYFVFLFIYVKNKKDVFIDLLLYGIGAAIVFAGYGIYLAANGALGACISQTLFGAAGAKGGIKTILFNWLVEGKDNFIEEKNVAFIVFGVMLLLVILRKVFPGNGEIERKKQKIVFYIFGAVSSLSIIFLYLFQSVSEGLTDSYEAKTYGFYLFATIVFLLMMIAYGIDIFRKNKKFNNYIGFFMLFGAIFAIGYGVGMSGSLAASQIALSTGVIICIFASLCTNKHSWISMSLVGVCAMCFVVFCSSYKFVYTYSWWGLTDSSVWEATETTNIDLFKGIKVSKEEKKIYEGIVQDIQNYTTDEDTIFVFPHMPVLYTASDRKDPGSFTKVQWYDVSTNDSVKKDIKIVEEASPKVIVIYNIPKTAIKGHEKTFNNNKQSETTLMMTTLRKYCLDNNYKSVDNYKINEKCTISVFAKEKNDINWNNGGTGTKTDPYTISTTEQFLNFADMVNGGSSFEGLYVKLTSDIDLSECKDFTPIGYEGYGASFDGNFDGNGYSVKNLTIDKRSKKEIAKKQKNDDKYNFALFGSVEGKIYNLGIENFDIKGYCVAGIVRHSSTKNANIINCFIKNTSLIGEFRAGAIADDYDGFIYNCIAINTELDADKYVGFVSYKDAEFRIESCYSDIKYYHDIYTELISKEDINSGSIIEKMNKNAKAYVKQLTTEKKSSKNLVMWEKSENSVGLKK